MMQLSQLANQVVWELTRLAGLQNSTITQLHKSINYLWFACNFTSYIWLSNLVITCVIESNKFTTIRASKKCAIPFQVAEVEQPLLSVAHLTLAGNRVELGATGGRIVNLKSGRAIGLERRGGVYVLKMYLADEAAPAPFRRQGS